MIAKYPINVKAKQRTNYEHFWRPMGGSLLRGLVTGTAAVRWP
jgi:hypothetical protein